MPNKKKLVILSGSGISAESGLSTFRDSGGLWEGYNINEVATPEGWNRNPEQVLDFYNLRREQAGKAMPNKAHLKLVNLESLFDVEIITQNVDDLHERAGSSKILHLHGELTKARSVDNENLIVEIGTNPIHLGDVGPDGKQLRPHVVWFGEMVPMLEKAARLVEKADILVVIGTSLVVYPAASLIDYAPDYCKKYIIDPSNPELFSFYGWTHIKERATSGIEKLITELEKEHG
ncbi:MAG: NAD-dependent deacylase [Balneola sp.]|nr:NAD-dependent deacylase [Balneola sp.]MBO6652297.1 NAD-dependent deacylase [Balneola sp.]MBO6711461.1 NAD-dependent deacylase [Balneola sp.]MBO6801185.1 NAD-dependent deacylase [Balneola sp.]MBO6869397.1 NAD-dependent deacylase [Balneola sp.]